MTITFSSAATDKLFDKEKKSAYFLIKTYLYGNHHNNYIYSCRHHCHHDNNDKDNKYIYSCRYHYHHDNNSNNNNDAYSCRYHYHHDNNSNDNNYQCYHISKIK